MEYNEFYPYILDYQSMPDSKQFTAFKEYLSQENILEQYASFLFMTLPSPRQDYYSSSDFHESKKKVLDYTSEVIAALGDFPVSA